MIKKRIQIGLILFGCVLVFGSVGRAGIIKFKMTNKDLPLPEGFKRVTAETEYKKEPGYGWIGKGARVEWRHVPAVIELPGNTGSYPDIITGSWVAPGKYVSQGIGTRPYDFTGAVEFKVDVPAGKYKVYMVLGDFFYHAGEMDYLLSPYSVALNGREAVKVALTEPQAAELYYRSEYLDYDPAVSYWRKYAKPFFERTTHKLDAVSDGSISVTVSNVPIAMLAIWPETESAKAEAWLNELEVLRETSCELKERKREAPKPAYTPTPAEKERGYVLFAANYMDDIFPDTAPDEKSINTDLTLFAAQNEFEPATFCIYPLKALKDARVKVGELKNEAGDVFPAGNIDVQWVKYMECNPAFLSYGAGAVEDSGKRGYYYQVAPFMLMHRDAIAIPGGVTKECWLTFYVPADTKPGTYTGTVEVTATGVPAAAKKVVLKVLPFRLKTLTELDKYIDLTISYIYPRHPMIWPGTDKKEMTQKLMKGWSDYGFNLGQAGFGLIADHARLVDGKVQIDFSACAEWLKGWTDIGVTLKAVIFSDCMRNTVFCLLGKATPPMNYTTVDPETYLPKEFDALCTAAAQTITGEFAKRGWPTPIFYEIGEGGGYPCGRAMEKRIHGVLHKAGVKNSLALSGDFDYFKEITPLVWLPFGYYFNMEQYQWLKERGLNVVYMAKFQRFERGLFFWRVNGMGHHAECYCSTGFGDPYNLFAGIQDTAATGLALPSRDGNGINPRLSLERDVREGHDDARYLFQLEELIREAKKSGKAEAVAAAEEAGKVLDQMRTTVTPDLEYYRTTAYPARDVYGKLRWRAAREIMKINEKMK